MKKALILSILSIGWQFYNQVWQAVCIWVLMLQCHFVVKIGLTAWFSNTIGDTHALSPMLM
jgi:hypothetical protein